MPDTIINWLQGLVKSIPENIISGLIISFLFLLLTRIVNKVKFLNSKIKEIVLKLFNTKIEISPKTVFIESPDYHYTSKRREANVGNGNSSDSDILGLIFLFLFGISIAVSLFIKYVDYISLFLKWFAIIPLLISIIFLFVISVSRKVQNVTVKFIIVSVVVSILTLYYGYNVKEMSVTMSAVITDKNMIISAYKLLGVFLGVVQQMIPYVLFLRVISVYIDRKKEQPIQLICKFIAKTKQFESVYLLIIMVMIFSICSYVFTLDAVHKIILKQLKY